MVFALDYKLQQVVSKNLKHHAHMDPIPSCCFEVIQEPDNPPAVRIILISISHLEANSNFKYSCFYLWQVPNLLVIIILETIFVVSSMRVGCRKYWVGGESNQLLVRLSVPHAGHCTTLAVEENSLSYINVYKTLFKRLYSRLCRNFKTLIE